MRLITSYESHMKLSAFDKQLGYLLEQYKELVLILGEAYPLDGVEELLDGLKEMYLAELE